MLLSLSEWFSCIWFCLVFLKTVICREDFTFNITMFFEAYVRQWLINTDSKTKSWVDAVSVHTLMWLVMYLKIDVLLSLGHCSR